VVVVVCFPFRATCGAWAGATAGSPCVAVAPCNRHCCCRCWCWFQEWLDCLPPHSATIHFMPSPQMKVLVEAAFEGWQRPADQPTPPPLPSSPLPDQSGVAGRLFLVDLPGSTQTTIAVGEPGGCGPGLLLLVGVFVCFSAGLRESEA
jgi:hypothetical protein